MMYRHMHGHDRDQLTRGVSKELPALQSPCKKVVVVEDDPSIGVLIASVLSDEGYEPIVVRDGTLALGAVRTIHPAAITLDLDLPGLDGHSFLGHLVDDGAVRPLPVVVVSANTESLSGDEQLLVAHALRKPFDLVDLLRAVEDVVRQ
ncbi:MAG: response regulator transcription factor [Chloroflexi bacterium]|nr:response regulator transcription factor [Chloroflexota bacterium]